MRPWVRGELSWLRSGPLFRIAEAGWPEVEAFLRRWGYHVVELNGRTMTSREAAHQELKEAFGFPDYYGANWDAFNDCMGDEAEARGEQPRAVVWRDLQAAADAAPVTTVEVGWALLEADLDVFVSGSGDDFDAPG